MSCSELQYVAVCCSWVHELPPFYRLYCLPAWHDYLYGWCETLGWWYCIRIFRLPCRIRMCDITHSYVRYDPFTCVIWLIHTCDMTHSYVWHDSFPLHNLHWRDSCVAESFRELQWCAVCCSELQWVTVCCSVLQWVTVSFSVLQCVAVCERQDSFYALHVSFYVWHECVWGGYN